jgi:predicted lipid-binding transport protein (Tim44 family)
MTQTPPPTSSSNPTEPAVEPPAPPDYAGRFAKGCGWTILAVLLIGGVVVFGGHGDATSWGSAIAGAIILIGVLGSSGLTGWWNK